MSHFGWIKLPRKIVQEPFWDTNEPFDLRSAFVDLMMLASHREHQIIFEMKPLLIRAGETLTSQEKLSARWRWSRKKVSNFLKVLAQVGLIELETLPQATKIRLCKWVSYQEERSLAEQAKPSPSTPKAQAKNTINNVKNVKNVEKKKEVNLKFVKAKKSWEELTPEEKSLAAECRAKYQNIFKAEIDKNKLCILVYGTEEDTEEFGFGDWEVLREALKFVSAEPLSRKVIMPHYYVWGYSRNREFVERMKKRLESSGRATLG